MLNHIIRVMVWINGFALEAESDILPGLAITLTSHVGMTQLGRVIMIMIDVQLLSH